MTKLIDLTGRRFARLLVTRREYKDKCGHWKWLCLCDCGQKSVVLYCNLTSGHTKSCGCLNIEKIKQRLTKHGHSRRGQTSKVYQSWIDIIQRCTNPNNQDYSNYGGRGIIVCKRWRKFENFLEDMGESPGLGYSIERIKNKKGYYPGNCKWVTPKEQARNRRNNHLITYDGKTQCIAVWAEELDISKFTLYSRIKSGWSTEKALTLPVRKKRRK